MSKQTLCDRCGAVCRTYLVAGQKLDRSLDVCDGCRTGFEAWWNNKIVKLDHNSVLEVVAEECHRQWSGWATHVLDRMERAVDRDEWALNGDWVRRWQRQIDTDYENLSTDERESDRREARRILAAIEALKEKP